MFYVSLISYNKQRLFLQTALKIRTVFKRVRLVTKSTCNFSHIRLSVRLSVNLSVRTHVSVRQSAGRTFVKFVYCTNQ